MALATCKILGLQNTPPVGGEKIFEPCDIQHSEWVQSKGKQASPLPFHHSADLQSFKISNFLVHLVSYSISPSHWGSLLCAKESIRRASQLKSQNIGYSFL